MSVARLSLGGEELLAVSAIDSGWVGDQVGLLQYFFNGVVLPRYSKTKLK